MTGEILKPRPGLEALRYVPEGAYRTARSAVLNGKVRVRIAGKRLGENFWVDEDVRLHPTANLEGRWCSARTL